MQIVRGLSIVFDGEWLCCAVDDDPSKAELLLRGRSSTCIRTLMRSNGYNKMVDADPPAMPARKEEMGEVLLALDGFCCEHC